MDKKTKDIIWFFVWFGVFIFGVSLLFYGIEIESSSINSAGIILTVTGAFYWGYWNHKMVSEER